MANLKTLLHSKIFPLIIVGFLAVLILFSMIFINFSATQKPSSQSVLPSPFIDNSQDLNRVYDEEYLRKAEEISKQPDPFEGRATKVYNFINILPYSGEFITVNYRISDNGVIVRYEAQNSEDANRELDELLTRNQIESRDWITNLVIQSN